MRHTRTIDDIAAERAKAAHVPVEAVRPYVVKEVQEHRFRIDYAILPHQELAEIVDVDGSHWLKFNINHAFVERIMLAKSTTPLQRSAMEVTLAVVLGATDDPPDTTFPGPGWDWQREQQKWSDYLETAIHILTDVDPKTGESMLGMTSDEDDDMEEP